MRFQRFALLCFLLAGCGGDPNGNGESEPLDMDSTTDAPVTSGTTTGAVGTTAPSSTTSAGPSSTTSAGPSSTSDTTGAGPTTVSTSATSSGSSAGGATTGSTSSGSSDVGGAGGTTSTGEGGTTSTSAGGTSTTGQGGTGGGSEGGCEVMPLTDEFRQAYDDLDPFYQKYADAGGLPVVSSLAPADEALTRVCELVIDMTSARPDALEALIRQHVRFAVIGEDELTNDIPEFSYLDDYINQRARGLGGLPAASCAEESILCNTQLDRWRGEGICVHEFAHTISMGGYFAADPSAEGRLRDAFQNAQSTGLFENTYAMENMQEYWAEGVQDWYFTNLESDPPNGIHNYVDRREELLDYDPMLYALIEEFLPETPKFVDCYSDE